MGLSDFIIKFKTNRLLKKPIGVNPYSSDGFLHKGLCKALNSNCKEAIKDYDNALAKNNNSIEALMYRGIANVNLENFKAAIEDFSKAIEINSNYEPAYWRGVSVTSIQMKLKKHLTISILQLC